MSPATLRRYRAERLLREEFDGLRGTVVTVVRSRLRSSGVRLDACDLEACYAQAWQGLYTAVLDGAEVANPTGWLTLVTYRRAIDEHRSRKGVHCVGACGGDVGAAGGAGRLAERLPEQHAGEERDLAAELDDRRKLRQLFEALRGRLSAREQQAAALCYLQGLSRSEAAARMGVSESRMRKLMEGAGAGSPGVAGKVGALIDTIRAGAWCEQQGSLMRGFAYGILDPNGERYRLAVIHQSDCPACRAYVLSLRGLAAALPPVPSLMHLALGSGAAAASRAGAKAAAGVTAPTGSPIGSLGGGAASASGAAGVSAAGGGWMLAGGPMGAKLAVGCLLALGVGAGCVVLGGPPERARTRVHTHPAQHRASSSPRSLPAALRALEGAAGAQTARGQPALHSARRTLARTAQAHASSARREFGLEQPARSAGSSAGSGAVTAPIARAASTIAGSQPGAQSSGRASASGAPQSPAPSAAQREFAPG